MKILIDMNLTPEWVKVLGDAGFDAQHWSEVGSPSAIDRAIMAFAYANGFVVFTHDLDFGNILAVTNARGPSVIQVRTQDPTPSAIGQIVVTALRDHHVLLERGSLVTIEPGRMRSRVLPLFST